MITPERVLVIRNDKLGDFMLSWPALAMLRLNLPQARVAALVPAYTAPLARVCPFIDDVLVDPKLRGDWRSALALAQLLRPARFDAVVTLFSRFDTALAARLAGIPLRYAPATKLAQIFYNRRIRQRRSRSKKPECAYNLDLMTAFLREAGIADPKVPEAPFLRFDADEIQALKRQFIAAHAVAPTTRLVVVHTGHGGSANNLSLEQYAILIRRLTSLADCHFVLTAGPGEEPQANALAGMLEDIPHTVSASTDGLVAFAKTLQYADLFISGSTGPLHIAGALNCRTAAFYPRRRSASALRWQTVNAPDRRLAFSPPDTASEEDMRAIDVHAAADEIAARFLRS